MIKTRQLPLLDEATWRPGDAPLTVLDQRQRGTTFHEVPVKAILNPPASTGMGFWSLNPYVGCEFGCTYCYARETHRWRVERARGAVGRSDGQTVSEPDGQTISGAEGQEAQPFSEPTVRPSDRLTVDPSTVRPSDRLTVDPSTDRPSDRLPVDPSTVRPSDRLTVDPSTDRPPDRLTDDPSTLPAWLAFEKQILVKTTAAAVLQRTLFPARLAGATLVIGTATDPYQPAERRFRLTREILEALLGWKGLDLGIITKSPLIIRDIDLLQRLSERHELSVNISLASVDAPLLRRLEARSPAPHARLRAVERLVAGGIRTGLMIAPILPGITDSRESLAAVLKAGKAAGAHYAHGAALRLGPAARSRFLPHLEHEFPELGARYHRRYDHGHSAGKDYTEALSLRIRSLLEEYGFPVPGRWRDRPRGPRKAAIPEVAEQWGLW